MISKKGFTLINKFVKGTHKGFTLIELMVTIAIIAVIASVGFATFSNTQKNARMARRQGDLKAIQTALATYYSLRSNYPVVSTTIDGAEECISDSASKFAAELVPTYMASVPKDPSEDPATQANCYKYASTTDGKQYKVRTSVGSPEMDNNIVGQQPSLKDPGNPLAWAHYEGALAASWFSTSGPSPTPTPTPAPTPTPTPAPTPTPTPAPTPTPTPAPTPTPPPSDLPPTVNITSPLNGQVINNNFYWVAATASDDVSVASVQFKVDGVNGLGPSSLDTTAPFQYGWGLDNYTNGSHVLTAVATDSIGQQTTSPPITVTINNVVYRAFASANNGAGSTTLSINKPIGGNPSGVQNNDVLVAMFGVSGPSSLVITPPLGWNLLRPITTNGTTFNAASYYKVITSAASEPASYAWNFDSAQQAAGGILRYYGVNNTTPSNVSAESINASSTNVTALSVTPTITPTRALYFCVLNAAQTITPQVGLERFDVMSTSLITAEVADEFRNNTAATGTRTGTTSPAAASLCQSIILQR